MKHLVAVSACLSSVLFFAAPACADPAADAVVGRFSKALEAVQTYTATITVHEVSGSRVQDRVIHTSVRKPDHVRDDIAGGDGKGGAAVWTGGDSVRGHQGGMLRFITLSVSIHDARATSMRGATIEQATFTWMLNHLKSLQSKLTTEAGPTIDGQPTDVLVASDLDGTKEEGMTKESFFLSRTTNLPVRFRGYEGTTLVRQADYTDLILNPPLSDSLFTL